MTFLFRATESFMQSVRDDLRRPHAFADERIGFITARAALGLDYTVLLADRYYGVDDADYVDDPRVGARINQEAIRKALEIALLQPVGVFHVHMHLFPTRRLWFSDLDLDEQLQFVPDFFKVRPEMPHGAIVLSPSSEAGLAWASPDDCSPIAEFNTVGSRLKVVCAAPRGDTAYDG